jgi:error-prone DNA polymerase
MVHPFLRRRNGDEPVTFPSDDVKDILSRTLGVPLFQEQAMKLAMVAAGFSPGDADALRRALTHKRAHEKLPLFRDRYIEGCVSRGYARDFAERSFDSFKGFSHYGFPESHSASFALIAYASSWLKLYYPAIFTAALLDAQPMGFYAPHTLVDDARRHGVEARAIDVNRSTWRCQLETDGRSREGLTRAPAGGVVPEQPALRLGLELVKGLREETAQRLTAERDRGGPFTSLAELARRTRVAKSELTRLILSGALGSITRSRRAALWELAALGPFDEGDLFFGLELATDAPTFPQMSATERVATDFDAASLSLESHPIGLLRKQLARSGAVTAEQLQRSASGRTVRFGGLVIVRQRPPTAKGFCFMSVEDETGIANLVIEPRRFEQFRRAITGTSLVFAEGRVERSGKVVNLKVDHLEALMLEERP